MDKIKYRAWNKYDISDNHPLKFEWDIKQGECCNFVYKENNVPKNQWFSYSADCIFCDDDWIKEQFIGLHDKNGIDIYEGDILATEERDVIFIIVWDKFSCGFKFKDDFDNCLLDIDGSLRELEVIGNVHDNTELIVTDEKV